MSSPSFPRARQGALFDDGPLPQPASLEPSLLDLRRSLNRIGPGRIHLGTSSWHFPGWERLVYAQRYPSALLSREGLRAYAAHPLMNTVSLDRAFYRLMDEASYHGLAQQVPANFRFVVKAPSLLTDACIREPSTGAEQGDNPRFLDLGLATQQVLPGLSRGLGERLGVLVLQLSPMGGPSGSAWLRQPERFFARLTTLLEGIQKDPAWPAHARLAVEVRDAQWLSPAFAQVLSVSGALYVLGLHDRLPSIDAQLPVLRALWPAPLVCRWNLQRGLAYGEAKQRFEPFNRLAAPDHATRAALARVVAATAAAGQDVFVTINNKAEGSAPLSVQALAQAVVDCAQRAKPSG